MNWDDLRFVAAVARHGSLLAASRELEVEHTTVGRRIDAAERALGAKLFSRTTSGLTLTLEGQRLLGPLDRVEQAVNALARQASADEREPRGNVRVTAPESFAIAWLAPRLAAFARAHPGLRVDLDPTGRPLDLGRREAEIALRFFRSKQQDLFVRRVGDVRQGLYATRGYLRSRPVRGHELAGHLLLADPAGTPEAQWLDALARGTKPILTSPLALALLPPARAGIGIALLPRYLGDAEPTLVYLPMPDEPESPLWLTVHRDLRATPRVRAVLDFLGAELTGLRTGDPNNRR